MRLIALDTETTGFSPDNGDRILEIGCIEMIKGRITNEFFHRYINPERKIPASSTKVHGINDSMVADKPVFDEIADDFLKFIGDSQLVIHNAEFDMRFLNHHLGMTQREPLSRSRVIDTLAIAKRKFFGASATLDALCKRFNINLRGREYHGALIDARLLAMVYIEMEYGNQGNLFTDEKIASTGTSSNKNNVLERRYVVHKPTDEELAAYHEFVTNRVKQPD